MSVKIPNKYVKLLLLIFLMGGIVSAEIPSNERSKKVIASTENHLKTELAIQGLVYGAPIFVRIFKQPGILELWLKTEDDTFKLFKSYEICKFSGDLGPKLQEGDNQSPEGFYFVKPKQLNPWSQFHLSFNLGYPNRYDRSHGRTGSALMVHGNCVSVGCYAMTDPSIDEIFTLAVAAFDANQAFFRVHIFPFKLESETLSNYKTNKWYSFWDNLREGYDYFNKNKIPPNVEVSNGVYIFDD